MRERERENTVYRHLVPSSRLLLYNLQQLSQRPSTEYGAKSEQQAATGRGWKGERKHERGSMREGRNPREGKGERREKHSNK